MLEASTTLQKVAATAAHHLVGVGNSVSLTRVQAVMQYFAQLP